MAPVNQGDTVHVHYTGKLEDGTEFDSSRDRDPLAFTVGAGEVIPGFEELVAGLEEGESKEGTIPSEQAYGPYREDLLMEVDRSDLPEDLDPEVGDVLQVQQPTGQVAQVTVSDVGDESVTLDGNHPLAGKDLIFEIEVVDVEKNGDA